jgi:phosphoribosyl 1,2-cyclic phosphodiesterase
MSEAARTIPGMTLRVTFLGSGSGGNSTLVAYGDTRVLVDAGFSAREIAGRLASHGEDPARLTAILVTHEHRDHACGVRVLQKRTGAPVLASKGTCEGAHEEGNGPFEHEHLDPGDTVRLGELRVTSFRVMHDAREPVGFLFEAPDGTRLGYVSDIGEMTGEVAEALAGCEYVALEANHDARMLEHGPYPWFLKRRIASANGHLSNEAAGEAIGSVASDRLRHVFAIHVSRTNNTPDLAAAALRAGLLRTGLDVPVTAVGQDLGVRFPAPQASLF